jgi:hypothetical protein
MTINRQDRSPSMTRENNRETIRKTIRINKDILDVGLLLFEGFESV